MSQIGYMFLAVGIGAYSAGFFHLMSHAFFKALLFMAAGNVIHAMHDEQDMRKYGGLFRQLPRTSWSFLIGSLSLVGVIPFVGFFSKEQILGAAFSKPDDPLALDRLGHRLRDRADHRLLHRPHVVDVLRRQALAGAPCRAPARGAAGDARSRS